MALARKIISANLIENDRFMFIFSFSLMIILVAIIAVDHADGAGYYCSKSCQEKLKAEEQRANKTLNTPKKVAEPCYGIYCDKKPKENLSELQQTKIVPKSEVVPLARNFIAIRVSDSCERIDYCPNIKDLADKFDNSNKYLSGDFIFDNNTNKWHRSSPKIPNVFELYRYTNLPWVLWVDPDDYTWDRSKQIIIEPQLRYIDRGDKIDETRIRYEYEGLKLVGCSEALIGWKNSESGNMTGEAILLDVLNYFYSNCREKVVTDPTVEIFMGSDVFEGCDKACLYYKQQLKLELKSEALVSKQLARNSTGVKEEPKEPTCYGIYCKKEKQTVDEKITEIEEKEKLRQERLKELEDINECNKWKQYDVDERRADKVNCNDKKQRDDYLTEMRKEYPDGVGSLQKYR